MTAVYVVHIERVTPEGATPVSWVAYHGSVALTGATETPYMAAVAQLQADGLPPATLVARRRRGVDLNDLCYPLSQAVQLVLENVQPGITGAS